uniref:Seven cysteines N terminal n=1 Tax=Echinococcus granulosus TaxID=6210 RepID=A0A068WP17_ECHGR|nr:Seven cysteines N terminal [Echinococcus granulosus]
MFYVLAILFFPRVLCEAPSCESTLYRNTRVSRESIPRGVIRLNTSFMSVEDCLIHCCSTPNCTTVTHFKSNRRCLLYNCGEPNICIRMESTKANLYYVVKGIPGEDETNPFWSRMAIQSKKQYTLTIAVLATIALVFLAGLSFCVYLQCLRRRRHSGGHSKFRNRRIHGVGGSYHILFNSDGEEPQPNGSNTLF